MQMLVRRIDLTFCLLHLVQGGQETDFILVSCSGAGVPNEMREKVLRAKQVKSSELSASYGISNFLHAIVEVCGISCKLDID